VEAVMDIYNFILLVIYGLVMGFIILPSCFESKSKPEVKLCFSIILMFIVFASHYFGQHKWFALFIALSLCCLCLLFAIFTLKMKAKRADYPNCRRRNSH